MTDRERVLAFFHHEMTDQLPPAAGLFVGRGNAFHERPPFVKDGTDWFGVKWKDEGNLNALAPDPLQEPILEDIGDWREVVKFPDLDAWDWSKAEEIDHVSEWDRENKVIDMMIHNGPFERMHTLMGFENALCALLTDPDEVKAYLDAYMEWKCKLLEKIHEYYHPDVIMFHDDYGTQSNMFFSPEIWRDIFKPQLKKAVDKTHELGMIFELHSCGFMEQIVPEFVDIGIDAWQGQEINDVLKLKELTKGKLAFHTTPKYQDLDAMTITGELTEEMVRERVRESVKKNAAGGNYMPMPLPGKQWWLDIMNDEIVKVGKKVYL